MFLDPNQFTFPKNLEARWTEIRDEYQRLSQASLRPWHEKHLYNQGWNVFGFYAFGKKIEKNCQLCPRTTEILAAVPGLMTAGFSILKPGTVIKPHRGYSGAVLRCHLGLVAPQDACLKVAGEARQWVPGKCLVFDDRSIHEAWNQSSEDRVVLLLDFLKPGRRFGPLDHMQHFFLRLLARA